MDAVSDRHRGVSVIVRRMTVAIGACMAVAASLLTFPNAIPWMIAVWLLCYGILVVRGGRAWIALAVCVGVLLAKRVFWTPGLYGFTATGAAVILAHYLAQRRTSIAWTRRIDLTGLAALALAWTAMFFDWQHGMHSHPPAPLAPDRPVACLGDSLTSFGAQGGYPEYLAKRIRLPVLNCGEPGITAGQAIRRSLPKALAADPQVVVVELGGHEFLRGNSREQAKESLEHLILACRVAGAEVILMEMPRGYMFDPYAGLERELARKHDLELIPDTVVRRMLLASPTLPPGMWTNGPFLTEADGLHPNARGNQLLAQYVAEALERMYGPTIHLASNLDRND